MWCSGARETREPLVTIGRTVSKIEAIKNLSAFQDLSGSRENFVVCELLAKAYLCKNL